MKVRQKKSPTVQDSSYFLCEAKSRLFLIGFFLVKSLREVLNPYLFALAFCYYLRHQTIPKYFKQDTWQNKK